MNPGLADPPQTGGSGRTAKRQTKRKRRAVVTGASKGLGRALCLALAREGFDLLIAARSTKLLEFVAREIRAFGVEAEPLGVDLADEANVRSVEEACRGRPLDLLVNNAGMVAVKPLDVMAGDEIRRIISLNLVVPILLTRAILPLMKRQRSGTIVNISSTAGKRPALHHTVYCATKYGVYGFGEALRMEIEEYGIRVITVCPCRMATELHTSAGIDVNPSAYLSPEDVAGMIVSALTLPQECCMTEMTFGQVTMRRTAG